MVKMIILEKKMPRDGQVKAFVNVQKHIDYCMDFYLI
jgi:hypothetical protein